MKHAVDGWKEIKNISLELLNLLEAKERPRVQGRTLLKAINERDARSAEAALEAGADVGLVDHRGDVALLALTRARWRGEETTQARLCAKLCKARADVNVQNARRDTALQFASHRGDLKLIEALLDLKSDVNLANAEGSTALMFAAHSGHEAICTLLLEAFAQPDVKNSYGLTAEDIAAKRGFYRCGVLISAYAIGPKRSEDVGVVKKASAPIADLTRPKDAEMQQVLKAMRPPDVGGLGYQLEEPSAPPKHAFDYGKWDKIVDELERTEEVQERQQILEDHPEFVVRDGSKMRVML